MLSNEVYCSTPNVRTHLLTNTPKSVFQTISKFGLATIRFGEPMKEFKISCRTKVSVWRRTLANSMRRKLSNYFSYNWPEFTKSHFIILLWYSRQIIDVSQKRVFSNLVEFQLYWYVTAVIRTKNLAAHVWIYNQIMNSKFKCTTNHLVD